MQKRPPMGGSRGSDHGGDAATGCRIGPASVTPSDQTAQVSRVKANSARRSTWRDAYAVHPAADVFPMMSDEDLAALGEDIKANGQTIPILFWTDGDNRVLIDGRNRLEAMERIGIADDALVETFHCKDPVTHIITLNIRRRHLTPQQQLDLIVAVRTADNKPGRDGPVSKGGHGKINPVKAAVMADAKAAGLDPSERTVKRAIAKAEGKTSAPQPKRYAARPLPKPRSGKPVVGLEAARRHYLDQCADPGVNLDEEQRIIFDALTARSPGSGQCRRKLTMILATSRQALTGGRGHDPPRSGRSLPIGLWWRGSGTAESAYPRRCRRREPMGSKLLHVKLRDKRNHPPEGEPWVWLTRELIESDAWRTAPINTRRFVERLMIEHMAHAGTENGKLVCTYDDLAKFGVASRHRHAAIADALARGLVDRTEQGKPSTGADRWPSKYALGWLPRRDGSAAHNRWRGWRKPPVSPSPITQDIKSRVRRDPRGNGRNPSLLGSEGARASRVRKCTGKLRKSAIPQSPKVP